MAEPTSMTLGTTETVTLSSASAVSSAIGTANTGQPKGNTTTRVAVTDDTWCQIGTAPVAVTNGATSFFMPGGAVEYLDIPFGHKVAGIVASSGYMSVTPCTDN